MTHDEELQEIQARLARMRAFNRAWRKAGLPAPDELHDHAWRRLADTTGMTIEAVRLLRGDMARHHALATPYDARDILANGYRARELQGKGTTR